MVVSSRDFLLVISLPLLVTINKSVFKVCYIFGYIWIFGALHSALVVLLCGYIL